MISQLVVYYLHSTIHKDRNLVRTLWRTFLYKNLCSRSKFSYTKTSSLNASFIISDNTIHCMRSPRLRLAAAHCQHLVIYKPSFGRKWKSFGFCWTMPLAVVSDKSEINSTKHVPGNRSKIDPGIGKFLAFLVENFVNKNLNCWSRSVKNLKVNSLFPKIFPD